MTNPTTPFSWQMPTSTDLVTDLPADFETFGQAVATSMADLLGGTTGQVLSKATNTDMDFTWVTTDDANAIQNSIVDAKGDLIAATANDTPARLAAGTDGYVLSPKASESTGLNWQLAQKFRGCWLGKSANQSIANNTETAITWDQETYDTDGFHSTSTNTSRITIPAGFAGYYQLSGFIVMGGATAGSRTSCYVKKNGSTYLTNSEVPSAANGSTCYLTQILYLTAGDYIEVTFYQSTGSAKDVLYSGYYTNLQFGLIGV